MNTKIYQNEHGVWILQIYYNNKLIREVDGDVCNWELYTKEDVKDRLLLIENIAKDAYDMGFSDGKYGV